MERKCISMKIIFLLTTVLLTAGGLTSIPSAKADDYNWSYVDTGCAARALIGQLTITDYSQDATAQRAAWIVWRDHYGLADGDYVDKRTKTYNCHAYVFYGTTRWLETPRSYDGTGGGCWSIDASGTVLSGPYHSCRVTNLQGKCGPGFLNKRNNLVYSIGEMPTVKYKQN